MTKFNLPKIGLRNIKTAISVFICILVFELIGRHNPLFACIAAVVCMQSTIENSIKFGVNRIVGTVIGGIIGILFLIIGINISNRFLYLAFVSSGIIFVIYINNLIKKSGAVAISCVVFLAILIYTNSYEAASLNNALSYSINRIIDTIFGIVVSVIINLFIRTKKKKINIIESSSASSAEADFDIR